MRALFLTFTLILAACGDSDELAACTAPDGTEVAHGETIPAGDNCNTCECWDGALECDEKGCVDSGHSAG